MNLNFVTTICFTVHIFNLFVINLKQIIIIIIIKLNFMWDFIKLIVVVAI